MPGESPTKWQAQAYRFGVRRLESAVSSGDPLLRGDQLRRRLNISLIVSFVLAALILGAFAVYGFISPEPKIGDAAVVIDSDTGGVFVSRDGRLYPAMNLSSALLAAGRGQSNNNNAPSTTTVDSDTIGKQPRGPLLGIPGAPDVLPSKSKLIDSTWTVCDSTSINAALPPGSKPILKTTAIVGEKPPLRGSLGTTGAMLVSPDNGSTSYLLWGGKRSKIDPGNQTIRLAFNLATDAAPRPISPALLNVIPEAPDLTVPYIDVSESADYANTLGVQVGEVFGLKGADRSRAIFVALPDGWEQVTPLVGDLIRDEYNLAKDVPLVSPKLLRQAPRTLKKIDLTDYPTTRPDILTYGQYPVACVVRSGTNVSRSTVFALQKVPVPASAKPVTVTKPGDLTVDDVYIHPGKGAVFSTGTSTQSAGDRPTYVITDEGVEYPVVNSAALTYLGLDEKPTPTAPELLNLLPKGPTLDPDEAVHFYPQTGASASSLPQPSSASAGPQG